MPHPALLFGKVGDRKSRPCSCLRLYSSSAPGRQPEERPATPKHPKENFDLDTNCNQSRAESNPSAAQRCRSAKQRYESDALRYVSKTALTGRAPSFTAWFAEHFPAQLPKIPIRCTKAQKPIIQRNGIHHKTKPLTTKLAKPIPIRPKLFHVEQFRKPTAFAPQSARAYTQARHPADGGHRVSITLTPEQQDSIEQAIQAGLVGSVDEFIGSAIGALSSRDSGFNAERARAAVARIRKLRKGITLDLQGMSIRQLAHAG